MELQSLMDAMNSNKGWHGYCSFYKKLFDPVRLSYQRFFEIGISEGSSLLAWKEYFPNATIYGIDIHIPQRVKGVDRIQYAICDQASSESLLHTLESWGNPCMDCILDDGGHHVRQQRVSIETLWKFVAPGGFYIIEDLHTNIRYYHSNHPHMTPQSTFIDEEPTIHEKIIRCLEGDKSGFPFSDEIEEIFYYMNPNTKSLSCAFQKKKIG